MSCVFYKPFTIHSHITIIIVQALVLDYLTGLYLLDSTFSNYIWTCVTITLLFLVCSDTSPYVIAKRTSGYTYIQLFKNPCTKVHFFVIIVRSIH